MKMTEQLKNTVKRRIDPERQAQGKDAVAEKLNQAYQAVLQGLRTSLVAGKEYGEALLDAQEQLGCNDTVLYKFVRQQTTCKLGDTTLANYKRLAQNWPRLEKHLGAENLQNKTLVAALSFCKKHKRRSKSRASAPATPSTVNQPEANSGDAHHDGPQTSGGKDEEPVIVKKPFDLPSKDRLAALYAENGPAPAPIQMMTSIIIPTLKRIAAAGVKDDDLRFLEKSIREATAILEGLKRKYALS